MKLKYFAAAVALAAAGTSVQAAPVPTDGLFISIVDNATATSFFGNIGVTTSTFLSTYANSNYTVAGDLISDLSAWIAGKSDLTQIEWNILGTTGGASAAGTGGLTTVRELNAAGTVTTSIAVDAGLNSIGTFLLTQNTDLAATDGVGYTQVNFIKDFGNGAMGIFSAGNFAQLLPFYQLIEGSRSGPGQINALAGSWAFDLNGPGNSLRLQYNAATAPVPVPAAAWLLGSALLGMAGISRRKKK